MQNRTIQAKQDFKKRQVLSVAPPIEQEKNQQQGDAPPNRKRVEEHGTGADGTQEGTSSRGSSYGKWIGVSLTVIAVAALAMGGKSPCNYTAHEWGTFTSVQGGDGVLLDWRPLETSRLPQFVYDWKNPGMGRKPTGAQGFTKAVMVT